MKDLQIFKNDEFGEIRTIVINNEPYFVGKDVAGVLGYTNPQKAIREHVDAEDKGVNEMDTPGGKQDIVVINESGLYSLILSSKLPGAKRFKKWVTGDVLPTIRQRGVYATDDFIAKSLSDPEWAINILQALKQEREQKRALEATVAELKPKAEFAEEMYKAEGMVYLRDIAKMLGISPQHKLAEVLAARDVLYRDPEDGHWNLYQTYIEKDWGRTCLEKNGGRIYRVTKFTPVGVSGVMTIFNEHQRQVAAELLGKRGYR